MRAVRFVGPIQFEVTRTTCVFREEQKHTKNDRFWI